MILDAVEKLRAAIAIANIPTLVPVLVQLTGDERWLEEPYRPLRQRGLGDNDDGGLPEDVQREVRDAALVAIEGWLAGAPVAVPEPSEALLLRLLSVSMGEPVPPEYGPVMRAGFGLHPEDEEPPSAAAPPSPPEGFRAIVIGAGASGLAMGVQLAAAGIDYTIYEQAETVGGTWWHNRYPGCGVDTPSHLYSYSFYEYDWPAYFSLRDTLHDYFESVARDLGVRPHIRFRTEVVAARYDERSQGWDVDVRGADGEVEHHHADVLISAIGAFGRPVVPNLPGLETFEGPTCHTARWPEGFDVTGQRVAVIGNGASAMQLVPAIVDDAEHVTVFQRSAQWAAPFDKFQQPVPEEIRWLIATVPLYRLWYRQRLAWNFNDKNHRALQRDPEWAHPERSMNVVNDHHREYFSEHIRSEIGDRQDLLAAVLPTYPPFGKRMLMDNGWFRTLTRDDVTLNASGAAEVRAHSVVGGDGREHEVDVLILATGFDVVRFLAPIDIVGRSGRPIRTTWDDDDAKAYLGTVVPDLPNFFCLYGPNLQAGHGGSLLNTVEVQVRYVVHLLQAAFEQGLGSVECRQDVHDAYNERVDEAHRHMVWAHPGMSTYYRNRKGRIVVNSPWRNVDFWQLARQPDLTEYETEPRRVPVH